MPRQMKHQEQEKVQEQEKQKQCTKIHHSLQCPNCETAYSTVDKFCAECGMVLNKNTCSRCGIETKPEWETCIDCGCNLQLELCSFCGGKMTADDAYCPECGGSREGVICDGCSTLNFRNFCRKCGKALTPMALEALEAAKNDPRVKKAIKLAEELSELEEYLFSEEGGSTRPELSEENKKLLDSYKDILGVLSENTTPKTNEDKQTESTVSNENVPKPKLKLNINIRSKEEALAVYKEKMKEMQDTLDSMIPDPSMTPQMQRDYYSVRKLEIVKLGWLCNAYSCMHSDPNQCVKPWMGGRWIYEERIPL